MVGLTEDLWISLVHNCMIGLITGRIIHNQPIREFTYLTIVRIFCEFGI